MALVLFHVIAEMGSVYQIGTRTQTVQQLIDFVTDLNIKDYYISKQEKSIGTVFETILGRFFY